MRNRNDMVGNEVRGQGLNRLEMVYVGGKRNGKTMGLKYFVGNRNNMNRQDKTL